MKEFHTCLWLYQLKSSPESLILRISVNAEAVLVRHCAGELVPLPLQTRKFQGMRHFPATKYKTTRCSPRLEL